MDNPAASASHAQELSRGERFAFGDNWQHFLKLLDEERIAEAVASLKTMLQTDSLEGRSFIDVGSGSGLFSLAARRLGARVLSFDYDPQSVACTAELKRRYGADDAAWVVKTGSVLDTAYLDTLGTFDVVYSWGVLHHTGAMWQALANVDRLVAKTGNGDGNSNGRGKLFIALYNHQPFASRYWTAVKKLYNRLPVTRPLLVLVHLIYPILPGVMLKHIQRRKVPRGMSVWYDPQ